MFVFRQSFLVHNHVLLITAWGDGWDMMVGEMGGEGGEEIKKKGKTRRKNTKPKEKENEYKEKRVKIHTVQSVYSHHK